MNSGARILLCLQPFHRPALSGSVPPPKFSPHSSTTLPSSSEHSPPPLHDFRYNTPEDVLQLIETVTDTSTLSLWCPDQDTAPSPSHSITLCCGAAYSANASSHGPTFGYRDWHANLPQGKGWRSWASHTPQYEPVSILFYRLLDYWTGYLQLDRATFAKPVLVAFTDLHSHYSPGLPAWSLPPHSLAHNVFALLYTLFYRPALLVEGFGAGAYTAAVAAIFSLAPPKTFAMGSPMSLLISLGGIAMHPPTFSRLIRAFASVHNDEMTEMDNFLKPRPDKASRPEDYASPWKDNRPEFKTAMLLVQHVHDRVSPWTLSPLLLSYLYNLGIKVITLHDNIEAQQEHALCFLSVCFLCMFSVCVFRLCFPSVFSVCVFSLCVFCVCFLSVFSLCVFSLCFLSVFSVCVFCLCFLSVFSVCVFCLCFLSLCFLSVFSVCVFCLCFLSVFSLCVSYLASPTALPKTIHF